LRFVGDRVVGALNDPKDYDGVVLATSIPGVKNIMGQSLAESDSDAALERFDDLRQRMSQLKFAPPYKVARVWLDRPTEPGRPDILETPQHKPVNLVALFHLLEDESRAWAERVGGSVMEFHLYADERWGTMPDDQVWTTVKPLLNELYPELQGANLIDMQVGTYQDFTSFEVGQGKLRPRSNAPKLEYDIQGLAFAGDWVKTDYPCALMEKSVSTGREAANHFLLADRVRLVPIKATSCHGPGLVIV
jgi:isorenieratene synthase